MLFLSAFMLICARSLHVIELIAERFYRGVSEGSDSEYSEYTQADDLTTRQELL